jgi:hypothetical protein
LRQKWDRIGDVWRIGTQFIRIDEYGDCSIHEPDKCECQEVWVGDDFSGNWDSEGIFDNYDKALEYVHNFLEENPRGWTKESQQKAKQEEREKVSFT